MPNKFNAKTLLYIGFYKYIIRSPKDPSLCMYGLDRKKDRLFHYLKEDINYDAKHGHSDENMTADEKHISKLAGDIKYDKKHHSPFNSNHDKFDPKEGVQQLDEVVVTLPEYYKKKLNMFDPGMPTFKQGPGGRFQMTSSSGSVDPFPSKAFTEGLGTQSAPGAPGASFTAQEVEEIKNRYKSYIKPKTDAKAFFASQS